MALPSYAELTGAQPAAPLPSYQDLVKAQNPESTLGTTAAAIPVGLGNAPVLAQTGAGIYAAADNPQSFLTLMNAGQEGANVTTEEQQAAATKLSGAYTSAREQQQEALVQSKATNPILTGTGQIAGTLAVGGLAGEAAAATLPSAASLGLTGTAKVAASAARGAGIGGAAGAATDPEHPLEGAAVGALTGGALDVAGQGLGAGVRALAKRGGNSVQDMADIAATSDALIKPTNELGIGGVRGAGTADVLGLPNLTGEQSIAQGKLNLPTVPSWVPGSTIVNAPAKAANKLGGWLSGAEESQGAKAMGAETAAGAATYATPEGATGVGDTLDILKNEPALRNPQAAQDEGYAAQKQVGEIYNTPGFKQYTTDVADLSQQIRKTPAGPAQDALIAQRQELVDKFKPIADNYSEASQRLRDANAASRAGGLPPGDADVLDAAKANYNNLSDQGKNAYIQENLSSIAHDAMRTGQNGLMDIQAYNKALKDMISTTGNTSMVSGERKWTLQGLSKLVDMAANNGLTKQQLAKASENIGSSGYLGAATKAAFNLLDDVVLPGAHGVALGAVKIPALYNIANRALDSKVIRNGLIHLAQGKTPTQQIGALSAIAAGLNSSTGTEGR